MWIKQLGTPEDDFSQGVAVDSNSNVFIAGSTEGSLGDTNLGSSDTWIAKYDSQGNLLWNRQLGTPDLDRFQGLATDLNGDVYLSGSTLRTIEGTFTIDSDAWVAKYDSQGNLLWNQQLASSGSESPTGVATDSEGNLYISGSTRGTPGEGGSSAWLIKYDSQGNLLSNQQLEASGSEVSAGIAIDNSGNLYLSGVTDSTSGGSDSDAWIAKYNADGNLLWDRQLGSSEYDYSQAVATDSNGNVYLSGGTNGAIEGGNAGLNDAWVAKYDPEGNLLWTKQIGTVGNDSAEAVTTDLEGNVYISGLTNGTIGEVNAGDSDAWVAKYDPDGNLLWTEQFGSPERDDSLGVALDSNNALYLSGSTEGSLDALNLGRSDAWVRQIAQPAVAVNNDGGDSLLNTPINRFQNSSRPGTYLFAGPEESQGIRENFPNFIEEGQAFKVAVEPGDNL
ncbi:MAG: SBBP repeat-containing protein, partial [Prochloraceae cyanobacterium]